jgi:hypothetical protein
MGPLEKGTVIDDTMYEKHTIGKMDFFNKQVLHSGKNDPFFCYIQNQIISNLLNIPVGSPELKNISLFFNSKTIEELNLLEPTVQECLNIQRFFKYFIEDWQLYTSCLMGGGYWNVNGHLKNLVMSFIPADFIESIQLPYEYENYTVKETDNDDNLIRDLSDYSAYSGNTENIEKISNHFSILKKKFIRCNISTLIDSSFEQIRERKIRENQFVFSNMGIN